MRCGTVTVWRDVLEELFGGGVGDLDRPLPPLVLAVPPVGKAIWMRSPALEVGGQVTRNRFP